MNLLEAGMKSILVFCAIFLLAGLVPAVGHAENGSGSAYDAIVNNKSTAPSTGQTNSNGTEASPVEPNYVPGSNTPSIWMFLLQVVFSLGVVILLIYLLFRFLGKRQLGGFRQSGPFKSIGGMPLGNGKSLQVVMIGDSLYVLGVGENIQLIRHIPASDEVDVILSEAEIKPSTELQLEGLIGFLRGKKQKETDTLFAVKADGSFEELLEKQWGEVNTPGNREAQWGNEEGRNRRVQS